MKKLLLLVAVGTFALSCQKEEIQPTTANHGSVTGDPQFSISSDCEQSFDLFAGQHIDAGNVTVSNDDDFIYVTFNTTGGWVLNETHVYVGDPSDIPTNGAGNPQIGNFPYNDSHNGITSYTITVPIDPSLECYAVAAHASVSLVVDGVVVQSETAWSTGSGINEGGSWATYSEYCLLDCGGCEYETMTYEYYGGQNILMGTLDVTNDGDNLYVTFNFTGDWYMGQTHLYVGDPADMPTNGAGNPVPGLFPLATPHDPAVQSFTYTIPLDGLPDCYAIAAHTEAMSIDGDGNVVQTETGWSSGVEFPGMRWGWYSEYCTQVCE